MSIKKAIGTGIFSLLGTTRMYKLCGTRLMGSGATLMFHRVSPHPPSAFPNMREMTIAPEFLGAMIRHLQEQGFQFVDLDMVMELVEKGYNARLSV